jgi:hypothetical protein
LAAGVPTSGGPTSGYPSVGVCPRLPCPAGGTRFLLLVHDLREDDRGLHEDDPGLHEDEV